MTAPLRDRRVPFFDLGPSHRSSREALQAAWDSVTASEHYVGGPLVEAFESEWASFCRVDHAVGVGNGTDALELALHAIGVGRGDEVLVPANTFIATAGAVVAAGATPRFIDVDPDTLLVTRETVQHGLTARTRAVIVVHLFGQAADMTGIMGLAKPLGLEVIEDCAQAHGARFDGQPVGSFGAAGCFSFYPSKNLGALGDGGAVITNDSRIAASVRQLGDHGRANSSKHLHPVVGRNSRLDALQAVLLSAKLPHLATWNEQRGVAAAHYEHRLSGMPGVRLVRQDPRSSSVHHLQVVRVADRDGVRRRLGERGIGTGVHYPVPCHEQPGYVDFPRSDLSACETSSRDVLSLPIFPGITRGQIDDVCAVLGECLADASVAPASPATD